MINALLNEAYISREYLENVISQSGVNLNLSSVDNVVSHILYSLTNKLLRVSSTTASTDDLNQFFLKHDLEIESLLINRIYEDMYWEDGILGNGFTHISLQEKLRLIGMDSYLQDRNLGDLFDKFIEFSKGSDK